MTQSLRHSNRGVKQAGFYVLGGAAMPAILIEIGFVTNPREERRLKETKYRDEIARAILAGSPSTSAPGPAGAGGRRAAFDDAGTLVSRPRTHVKISPQAGARDWVR